LNMKPQTTKSPNGILTFAFIDSYEDTWHWAIVTDYEDAQNYGYVLMAFAPENEPDTMELAIILEALENNYVTIKKD
jgi:hypothetical protein